MTHWPLCELVSGNSGLSVSRYVNTFIDYQGVLQGNDGEQASEVEAFGDGAQNRRCW